jgi:hypothetical protein
MAIIARKVKSVESSQPNQLASDVIDVATLRTLPAWVLLGEPGAGKTEVFKSEARAVGGQRVTVAEFIASDVDATWENKCLFLDGLDEVRVSGANPSLLYQIKSKLKKLGWPPFRIACRAADWFGQSDIEAISDASADKRLPIYTLEPLTDTEIRDILRQDFQHEDASEFIANANSRGIGALLQQPQTLGLIAKAVNANNWPNGRDETYQLACKVMVAEHNAGHRNLQRSNPMCPATLLEAAGQICATLLLADQSGVALDEAAKNSRYPALADIIIHQKLLHSAKKALDTALFVPSSTNDQQLEPIHRSVAEYLAATWLSKQIDEGAITFNRIKNILLGFDGKAVTGLRGLYGWLAQKCLKSQSWLIKNDPVTVVLYSDFTHVPLVAKQQLLHEIKSAIQQNPVMWRELRLSPFLSGLYQSELRDEYVSALLNTNNDHTTQTYAKFILDVLQQTACPSKPVAAIKQVVADDSREFNLRRLALEVWLDSGVSDAESIDLLHELNACNDNGRNSEIISEMLRHFYPRVITTQQVLRYFPEREAWKRLQHGFWRFEFAPRVPEADLPDLLDHLANNNKWCSLHWEEYNLASTLCDLVARAVIRFGDSITGDQLFSWLRIGVDEQGRRLPNYESNQEMKTWLSSRPSRYKDILGFCYDRNETGDCPLERLWVDMGVLEGVTPPKDLGLWHFQRISQTRNNELIFNHVFHAVTSLGKEDPPTGLSLQMVFDWAGNDPDKNSWLKNHLPRDISEEDREHIAIKLARERERRELRAKRASKLSAVLSQIRSGQANPVIMHELADVWNNLYSRWAGATEVDRFGDYCDNYEEVYEAARIGFLACVQRNDLPKIHEIIDLNLQQQTHYISSACLLGMELRWSQNPSDIESLDEQTLAVMVCFWFTNKYGQTPKWYLHLLEEKPDIVAKVLVAHAGACFAAKTTYGEGIYVLCTDERYIKTARLCVAALLKRFPTRIAASQLKELGLLLRCAIKHKAPELNQVIAERLDKKSLDPSQRVYFLLAGLIINSKQYEQQLWDFVGTSYKRIKCISDFIEDHDLDQYLVFNFGVKTIGKLIEIQAPFADMAQVKDIVVGGTPSRKMARRISWFIEQLATGNAHESYDEINRLLGLATLREVHEHLRKSKYAVVQRLRENTFTHPTVANVARILNSAHPINAADLKAIVLDHLDQIAMEIRSSNSDPFRQFWTEASQGGHKLGEHKTETSCRDALLEMLRQRLVRFGITIEPEFDCVNDKSVDINATYFGNITIPIEVKGEWHPELWTAIQKQLVGRYTRAPGCAGLGIYLVLWFGGGYQPSARDGGSKAKTPQDLEMRLQEYLPRDLQGQITVRVIDVTPP